MIRDLPSIKLPDSFTRLCGLNIRSRKKDYSQIADIIHSDRFLNMLVTNVFSDRLVKSGLEGLLSNLGWEGVRNRLAEAYLYKTIHGQYPDEILLNNVEDILDFESRFDFIKIDGCQRIFLLGFFLKLAEITLENKHTVTGHDYLTIENDVDHILKLSTSKSSQPDWLLVVVWELSSILGFTKLEKIIEETKGNFTQIIPHLSSSEHESLMRSLVKYGYAINDNSFFLFEKV